MKKIIIVSIILILGIVNYTDSSDTNYTDFKFNKTGGRPDGATFAIISYKEPQNHLPKNKDKPFYEKEVKAYAYNLLEGQTDSDPLTGASGRRLDLYSYSVIACNWLPFNTPVEIDNRLYIVQDRMDKRYVGNEIDILMDTKENARKFGVQTKLVKIYE